MTIRQSGQRRTSDTLGPIEGREHTFFVPGPLPGLNEVVAAAKHRRGNWTAYGDLKRKWTSTIQAILRTTHIRSMPAATLQFVWCEKDRRRDPDNIASAKKFILDALVQEGVLTTDGWQAVKGWEDRFRVDAMNPGVHVTVIEVQP